jgi:predicted peroxiredoxin
MKKGEDGVNEPYHLLNTFLVTVGGYEQNLERTKMLTEISEEEILKQAIKEFKEKGGKITVCEPGARTEDIVVGQWGKRKKRKIVGPIKTDKFGKKE